MDRTITLSRLYLCALASALSAGTTVSKLDFIQLCGIAHRIHEAFEQFTRNLYHVGLLE